MKKMRTLCISLICMGLAGCAGTPAASIEMIIPPHAFSYTLNTEAAVKTNNGKVSMKLEDTDHASIMLVSQDSDSSQYPVMELDGNLQEMPVAQNGSYAIAAEVENDSDEYKFVHISLEGGEVTNDEIPSLRRIAAQKKSDLSGLSREEIMNAWGNNAYQAEDGSLKYAIDASIITAVFEQDILKSVSVTEPVILTPEDNSLGFAGKIVFVQTEDETGYVPVEIYHWNDASLRLRDSSRNYSDLNKEMSESFEKVSDRLNMDIMDYVLNDTDEIRDSDTSCVIRNIIPAEKLDAVMDHLSQQKNTYILWDNTCTQNYVCRDMQFDRDQMIVLDQH